MSSLDILPKEEKMILLDFLFLNNFKIIEKLPS
jgi:hypothetical protein